MNRQIILMVSLIIIMIVPLGPSGAIGQQPAGLQNVIETGREMQNGDLDGDGDVDFSDFLVFVSAFGTREGGVKYNPAADLDGNGIIEFPDFLIFADAFGKPVGGTSHPIVKQQHDDRVVVMSIPGSLETSEIDFELVAQTFFTHYHDAFDYLMFFSNLEDIETNERYTYYGIYMPVQNTIEGTNRRIFSRTDAVGSRGKLNGIIHFPYNSALLWGPSLHEIMHSWANFAIPTQVRAHWGFSSADGQLGGFNIVNLVDRGNGQYTAGRFGTVANGGNSLPYSPIELYFAGLIPPSEVPDIWVAEDGQWLEENNEPIRDDAGNYVFTASQISTWSINRIVNTYGARIPDSNNSQKHFRAAVILLVDQNHPADQSTLDRLSAEIQQFTHIGNEDDYTFNFWEATGGRATMAMDGLSTYRKAVAGKPAIAYKVLPAIECDHANIQDPFGNNKKEALVDDKTK